MSRSGLPIGIREPTTAFRQTRTPRVQRVERIGCSAAQAGPIPMSVFSASTTAISPIPNFEQTSSVSAAQSGNVCYVLLDIGQRTVWLADRPHLHDDPDHPAILAVEPAFERDLIVSSEILDDQFAIVRLHK